MRPAPKTQTKVLRLYQPHKVQQLFHNSLARFRVAKWGRQSGKSTGCLNDILKRAWEKVGQTIWFCSPTYDQAQVQYRRLVGMLWKTPELILKKNQTELRVKLINQSQIRFVSGEVLENLRGETLHGAVVDEVREQHPDLWKMVLRPMLATTKGWGAFVSTPNGFDQFYDLFEMALNDKTGVWECFTAPSTCNPLFTQEEFEAMKYDMPEAAFCQEILAEFRDITQGKAYTSHGSHNHAMSSPLSLDGGLVSPWLPVTVGLDFNVNPMAWHLGQFRGRVSYWFGEIHVPNTNTPECAKELVNRLVELRDQGLLKATPQVQLVGDATGNSRNTKATESDYTIICQALDEAGITWTNDTPKANPPVKTRVNCVNGVLKSAAGVVQLFYHPGLCPKLKRDFERVAWKPGANSILDQTTKVGGKDGDETLTHDSDGVGYPVSVYAPIELYGQVGGLHIISPR